MAKLLINLGQLQTEKGLQHRDIGPFSTQYNVKNSNQLTFVIANIT